ncbi:MAG: KTSC domain-containing protein [Nakamurella sp.]
MKTPPPQRRVHQGLPTAPGAALRRLPVESTSMESVGFDPATNQLEIEFRDGGVYRYSVPRRIHQELMSADSLGAYFARRIRHHYPGWKVQG